MAVTEKLTQSVMEIRQDVRHILYPIIGKGIPLAVIETIEALWTKERMRPMIINKKKTSSGWNFIIELVPGISYADFEKKQEYFATATGKKVLIEPNGTTAIMQVYSSSVESSYFYEFTNVPGELGIPFGLQVKAGVATPFNYDICKAPHIFISGPTRKGKSNLLRLIATHLTLAHNRKAFISVIDYGGADFMWLEDRAVVVSEIDKARDLLETIYREMVKREAQLTKARVNKINKLPDPPPYLILIIDEWIDMAEDEDSLFILNKLLRKGAKHGLHVIAGCQRLDSMSMKGAGAMKNNFPVRISFRCNKTNSNMVLDCDAAAKLPNVPGRCIFMDSDEPIEIQCYLIEPEDSEKLIKDIPSIRRDEFVEQSPKRLPPRSNRH